MHKNKKLIMFFKILLVVTCIAGIVVGAIAIFKSEKSPETPKTTEAPQLREELTTFDYYLTPEELLEYPVHDMQDYITYDYAAIVNKQQKPLFVSDYYTELLNTPEKHNSCEIPQKTIDEFVKQYEIHKDDD